MFKKFVNFFLYKINEILKVQFGNNQWVWPKYRLPYLKTYDINDNYEYLMPLASAQVKSCLLLAALSSKNKDLNNIIQDCIEAAEENILQIAPDD